MDVVFGTSTEGNKLLFIIISNSLHLCAKARKWLQNYFVALPEVSHKK